MADSKIEWTEKVWNPVRGCTRVSPGCVNCYAERQAIRFSGPGGNYAGLVKVTNGHPQWTGKIALAENKLLEPLEWRKPSRIFVNSMSDLFHESVPAEFIFRVFAVMAIANWHTFQILTKRPERMRFLLGDARFATAIKTVMPTVAGIAPFAPELPLKNVWLGVSVEDQQRADERIPLLLETPAAVPWLSIEPLLGPVNLHDYLWCLPNQQSRRNAIRWIVVGGESGPHARPMHSLWVRSLRDQCEWAGVPYFFKQWGEWLPEEQVRTDAQKARVHYIDHMPIKRAAHFMRELEAHELTIQLGKQLAGRELDGREHNEYPEVAHV